MRRALSIGRVVLVYLLLGFVVTWAVAWGLAAFVPLTGLDERTRLSGKSLFINSIVTHYAVGSARAEYTGAVPLQGALLIDADGYTFYARSASSYNPLREPQVGDEFLWCLDLTAGAGWGSRHRFVELGFEEAWNAGIDDARGLPFLCLWSTRWMSNSATVPRPPAEPLLGGIDLPPRVSPQTTDPFYLSRALPYYPIWSGLALNTAFYALLFFAVVRITRGLKHARRYQRGLCPKCKYDRLFDYRVPCPECGHHACKRAISAA